MQKYYNIKNILKQNAQYNLIYGKRSNGKSYQVKKFLLERFRDYGEKFVLIRRYRSDITQALTDIYFADTPLNTIFPNGEYDTIYTHGGRVYIAKLDDGKRTNAAEVGYVRALSEAQRYASGAYVGTKNAVFEEFISLKDGDYLPNEIMVFRHLISTVFRNNSDVKVFLIANTISRLSPYWREFGVDVNTQAQGTIVTHTVETEAGTLKIACEYCADTTGKSKLFFGEGADMTNEGKWLTREYPHITAEMLENSESVFVFVVEYNTSRFLCDYRQDDDGGVFVFVTPKTSAVQPYTLCYTNRVTNNLYYRRGLTPRNARERAIIDTLKHRSFFADNLTGTEFFEAFKRLLVL